MPMVPGRSACPESGVATTVRYSSRVEGGTVEAQSQETPFWPEPPKVSHGGGRAERAPVTCVSSNHVPASATLPGFEAAAIRTAGSVVARPQPGPGRRPGARAGQLHPGLAVRRGGAAR